jgi:hypothetical protein
MKSQVNYRGRKIDYIGSEKDKAKVERLMDTYTEQLDMFEDSSYSSKPNRDIALLEEYEEIEIGTREALIVENNKETKKVIIQYIDDDEMEEFTYDELDSKLNQGRKNINPSGLSSYIPMGSSTPSVSKGDYLMVTKKGDEYEGEIGKNISVQSFYGNNPVVLLDFEHYGGGKKRYKKSEVTVAYGLPSPPDDAITDIYDEEFFRWGNAKINENWERSPLDFNDKGEIIFKPNTSEAEKKRIKAEFEKDIKEMSRMRYDNGGALDKEFKFDKNFVIYVPSTTDVGSRIDRTDLDARVSAVEKFVSERFGGFTKIDSDGGYKANSGDIIEEDIVKVSVFAKDLDWKEHENEVVAKVKQWAKDWGQEAIGFEYEGNLYYIEEDEKFSWGGGIAVGAVVGGYIGYKIGRWRPQKKGFDTEKKIAKKIKTSTKKGWDKMSDKKDSEKKMSKGGEIKKRSERDSIRIYNAWMEYYKAPLSKALETYDKFQKVVEETQIPKDKLQKITDYAVSRPKSEHRHIDIYQYWDKSGSTYAEGGEIIKTDYFKKQASLKGGIDEFSVDIDLENGEQIRDYNYKNYEEAKIKFNEFSKGMRYLGEDIENLQLLALYGNGDYDILDSKMLYAEGGMVVVKGIDKDGGEFYREFDSYEDALEEISLPHFNHLDRDSIRYYDENNEMIFAEGGELEWIQTEPTREKAEEVRKKLEDSGKYSRLMIRKNSPKQASRGHGTFYRIWGKKYREGGNIGKYDPIKNRPVTYVLKNAEGKEVFKTKSGNKASDERVSRYSKGEETSITSIDSKGNTKELFKLQSEEKKYAEGGKIPTSWKVKLKHKENNKAENITLSNSDLDEGDETITTEKDARYYALQEVQRPYDWEVVSVIPVYAEGGKIKSVSARRYEDLDYTDNELGERYYVEYNLYYDTDQFEETDEPDYESFDTEEEALKQVEYVNNNNQKFIEEQGYNNTYAEGGGVYSDNPFPDRPTDSSWIKDYNTRKKVDDVIRNLKTLNGGYGDGVTTQQMKFILTAVGNPKLHLK